MSEKKEKKLPFDQTFAKAYLSNSENAKLHLNGVKCRADYKISSGSKILDKHIDGGFTAGLLRFVGPTETGKALPIDEPVLTPNGWVPIGELKVGDEVIDSEGGVQKVIGVFPQGVKDVYDVTFKSGAKARCCGEHLWEVSSAEERSKGRKSVRDLNYIKDTLMYGARRNYSVRSVKPVEFNKKNFLIKPYLLGILLGDGGITDSINITNVDQEVWDGVEKSLDASFTDWSYGNKGCDNTKRICFKDRSDNPIISELKRLDLFGKKSSEKFIPEEYKFGSIKQRLNLLQALVDTDGFIGKNGVMEFYSTSQTLVDDFIYLVRSLGGVATKRSKNSLYRDKKGNKVKCKDCFVSSFSLPIELQVCRITRKLDRVRTENRFNYDFIDKVEESGRTECVCIRVSSDDHLFVTRDFILTHNTAESLVVLENFLKEVPQSKGILVKAEGRLSEKMRARTNIKFVEDADDWVDGTCLILKTNVYEVAFGFIRGLTTNRQNKTRYCIVIDSMDGLIRKDDLEKSESESEKMAAAAVMTSVFLKRTNLYFAELGHLCIMIAQVRAEIRDQYKKADRNKLGGASGGNAAVHYPNWVLEFERAKRDDYFGDIGTAIQPEGRYVPVTICKSENETTMMKISYPVKFGVTNRSSIWHEKEIIDLLLAWGFIAKTSPKSSWLNTDKDLTKFLGLDKPKALQGIDAWYQAVEDDKEFCDKLSQFTDKFIINAK